MNREKVTRAATMVIELITDYSLTPDETVAFLKCLEHVFQTRAIEKDLVVASLKQIKAVCAGLAPIEKLLPKGIN